MIINSSKDEKEMERKTEKNNLKNESINNAIEETSSLENFSGEEEDEDDLLKNDTENDGSNYSEEIYINPYKNNDINNTENQNNQNSSKKEIDLDSENKNKNDNKKELIHLSEDFSEDNKTNKSKKSEKSEKSKKSEKSEKSEKSGKSEINLSNRNEEYEEMEEGIEESDESESESINPYSYYIKSNTKIKNIFDQIGYRKSLYEKGSNKFFFYLFNLFKREGIYLYANLEYTSGNKKRKLIENILKKKYFLNNNQESNIDLDNTLNEIIKEINKSEFLDLLKEDDKNLKNEAIIITKKNFHKYSVFIKAKIYYLNFLNKKYTFDLIVNINWTAKDFIKYFSILYHIPIDKSSYKTSLTLFINNKQLSPKELISNFLFSPPKFNKEKDYVLILEHENFNVINIDLGSNNSKHNFNAGKVPHIVFSSHNNFFVESIIVSNKLEFLDCEVYIFKDEFYFNLDRNVGKYNFKKAKNILCSSDWKNKCKYITSIKSIKSSSYKNNEDAMCFSISPNLILQHDKTYVFLIKAPNFNINVFSSGSGDQGLFIISSDDKSILNGFICKKISDLSLE